jgi:hypothetical protein
VTSVRRKQFKHVLLQFSPALPADRALQSRPATSDTLSQADGHRMAMRDTSLSARDMLGWTWVGHWLVRNRRLRIARPGLQNGSKAAASSALQSARRDLRKIGPMRRCCGLTPPHFGMRENRTMRPHRYTSLILTHIARSKTRQADSVHSLLHGAVRRWAAHEA